MKVLFQNRFDYLNTPGGDTTQLLKTKEYLEKIGVDVDVSTNPNIDLSKYDLVHIFNIMRPFETYLFIKNALKQNKKIVMSSIYWDFDEFNKLGRNSKLMGFLYNNFDEFFVEKIKYFKRKDIIFKHKNDFFSFFIKDYKKILENVDLFLPNSGNEGKIVQKKISDKINYQVVFNAVDKENFYLKNFSNRNKDSLIVSRIDPRKNILNLVEAFKDVNYQLDIYGNATPLHLGYLENIKQNMTNNINLNDYVSHEKLIELYSQYKLHILPSWLETPGLSQLEAAACGCNILSTNRGSAEEYFGEMAFYCTPNSIESIKEGVIKAMNNLNEPNIISEFILDNYTWDKTAIQTKNAYERVLNNNV